MHPGLAVSVGVAAFLVVAYALPVDAGAGQVVGGFLGGLLTGILAGSGAWRSFALGLAVGVAGGLVVATEFLRTLASAPFGFLLLFGGTALFALVVVGVLAVVAGIGGAAGGALSRWTRTATK